MNKISVRIERIEVKQNGDQVIHFATIHDDFPGDQIFFSIEKSAATSLNDLQTQTVQTIRDYWGINTDQKI